MAFNKIKSHAKINLALNIIGKNSSLHNIETIIAFISLHDDIFIKKIAAKKHKIKFVGKFSGGISKKNTVSKLLFLLEKKSFIKNKKFQIRIDKKTPIKAGLGGGSMNAANLFKYFIKKKIIKIGKKEIITISNLIGSDVILGLNISKSFLSEKKRIKIFPNYKKFYILIVKPNFGCSTNKIYSRVKKFTKPMFNKPNKKLFNINYLKKMNNALEPIVLSKYSQLKKIKLFLENSSRPFFVRMTGSGSALVAYFQSKKTCDNAQKIFSKKYKNYWCITSKTI
tara:strand:+ start:3435 stop:4280 length:846 start_codon:yes stop_codon:yes gene_type:complete